MIYELMLYTKIVIAGDIRIADASLVKVKIIQIMNIVQGYIQYCRIVLSDKWLAVSLGKGVASETS